MPIIPTILLVGLITAGSIAFFFLKHLQTQGDLQAILKTTQWLATLYAAVVAILTLVSVVQVVFTRTVPGASLPISPWRPNGLNLEPTDSHASLENFHFDTITADVTGFSLQAALLLAGSLMLGGIVQVSIALAFRALAQGQLKGTPFRAQFASITQSVAWVVLICGFMAPILEGFGAATLAAESLTAWALTDGLSSAPTANLALFINFWPIGVFLMLYTLSAILDFGEQLQKSTEGLV